MKLRTALEQEDTEIREIAELIRNDPALAASVLRTANSAAFGGLKSTTDLVQAIGRLGLTKANSTCT